MPQKGKCNRLSDQVVSVSFSSLYKEDNGRAEFKGKRKFSGEGMWLKSQPIQCDVMVAFSF